MELRDIVAERRAQTEAVETECTDVEGAIAALNIKYDQYFQGIERKPPTKDFDDLKKRINKLRGFQARNTALKFRVQSLANKFLSYERLWSRTMMEIENGTYSRDIFKARLHAKDRQPDPKAKDAKAAKPEAQPAAGAVPPPPPPDALDGAAKRPGAPAAKAAAKPAASSGGLSDNKVKAIYDAYVAAKKQCKEDTSRLSLDGVAASLRKQVPELLKKHNAKDVDFKVVIKDGKATLRAVPKS